MVMTWQLMWLNLSVVTLNATFQLLVIYRLVFCLSWVGSIAIHVNCFVFALAASLQPCIKKMSCGRVWAHLPLSRMYSFFFLSLISTEVPRNDQVLKTVHKANRMTKFLHFFYTALEIEWYTYVELLNSNKYSVTRIAFASYPLIMDIIFFTFKFHLPFLHVCFSQREKEA